jgi:hypothetical protein
MENDQLSEYFANPGNLNEGSLDGLKQLTEKYPYCQSLWLLYLKNLKIVNHPDFDQKVEENAIRIADRKKMFYVLHRGIKNHQAPANGNLNKDRFAQIDSFFSIESENYSPPKEGADLIDNFIATKPTIRIKNEGNVESQTDFSENSIVENDEIITETYANILVQQKKYGRAIESFEKLSLRFPEKSIYFAGRIEEIHKLKDN